MIENIIDESYNKNERIFKNRSIDEIEKNDVFGRIDSINLEVSTFITNKVKKADVNINSNIDNLLSYSGASKEDKITNDQMIILKKIISSEPVIKKKKKHSKYLFKGNFTISENIKKTKFKEFSFMKSLSKSKTISDFGKIKKIKFVKKYQRNNNNKFNLSNKSNFYTLNPYNFEKSETSPINKNKNINNNTFFITKIPEFPSIQKKMVLFQNITRPKTFSKKKDLRKIKKIIKESNSKMLDIYNGLKDLKQNKYYTINNEISQSFNITKKIKSIKIPKSIDKLLKMNVKPSITVHDINRKFNILFRRVFNNKQFSNEKLDARTIIEPLNKITKGNYKEVKLDNTVNKKLGKRIFIKKSTANIVSYGKSCHQIADDIFYKERKRILGIYPKLEEEAKLLVPTKKIEKRNHLIERLRKNVNKINNVYLKKYNLIQEFKKKMDESELKFKNYK